MLRLGMEQHYALPFEAQVGCVPGRLQGCGARPAQGLLEPESLGKWSQETELSFTFELALKHVLGVCSYLPGR